MSPVDDGEEDLVAEDWPTFYTPTPVWVMLAAIPAQAFRLYVFLAEHINSRDRTKRLVWPKQKAIARALGLKNDRQVAPYRKALEDLGAIKAEEYTYAGGMRRGYRYYVRFNPPPGYTGMTSLGDFYKANADLKRANTDKTPGQHGGTKNSTSQSAENDTSRDAKNSTAQPHQGKPDQEERDVAPSARSAPDAGGSTSGSRDRAASGSAAPGQTQRLTIEQKQAVQRVRDLLPREFDRALPVRTPRAVADAVLDALAAGTPSSRTPEQLVEYRVTARWNGYWAPRFLAGEVDSPIGVLRALLAPASRDHDRCDERVNVDTGEPCVPCKMRAGDREKQRREEAAQTLVQAAPGPVPPAPSERPVSVPPRQRSVPRPDLYDAARKQPQPVIAPTDPVGDYTSGASAARAEMRSKKADAHRRVNLLHKAT